MKDGSCGYMSGMSAIDLNVIPERKLKKMKLFLCCLVFPALGQDNSSKYSDWPGLKTGFDSRKSGILPFAITSDVDFLFSF